MVTHQLQVERRTGKVRQSETDVLPLCYATNVNLFMGGEFAWPPVMEDPTVTTLGRHLVSPDECRGGGGVRPKYLIGLAPHLPFLALPSLQLSCSLPFPFSPLFLPFLFPRPFSVPIPPEAAFRKSSYEVWGGAVSSPSVV